MAEDWTRDECIVVLDLYINGEDYIQDENDETVQRVAETIGRSPGAVVMRLANYRSVDPDSTTGLTNIGNVAESVWQDYRDRPEELRWEADRAKRQIDDSSDRVNGNGGAEGGSESTTDRKIRYGQREFREAVLDRYGRECILCDVDSTGLLIAGHVLPWSSHEEERRDPTNGLVLCETHHEAFDLGFFTISSDMKVRVNPSFTTDSVFLSETMVERDGDQLEFGESPPSPEYLSEWNERYPWISSE